jgi:CYTH domain-containing protein
MGTDPGKYSRVERDRRFVANGVVDLRGAVAVRRIVDRYITGTRLRLRRMTQLDTGEDWLKLTQKVPSGRPGAVQGWITTAYLNADEYELLAVLPAAALTKTRYSLPPMGVDVFEGELEGLVLMEAEFGSDDEILTFVPPTSCGAEVTADPRFTGGRLAVATRADLEAWLAEIGASGALSP